MTQQSDSDVILRTTFTVRHVGGIPCCSTATS